MTTIQDNDLNVHMWALVNFCRARGGKAAVAQLSPSEAFRYISFCYLTGRMAVLNHPDEICAVVFYWPDFKERIEAKAAEGHAQFEWGPTHHGDALFIGDVIGDRKAVAQLRQSFIEKWPHLMTIPLYTLRHGKLRCLPMRLIERFVA